MKIVKLGEVVDLFNGSTPLKTNKDFWVNGDVPWFTVDDLRKQGKYITHTEKFITKLGLKESSISLVPENAVLLCCTASVGAIAINKIQLTTNQQFNALVVKDSEQLLVEYLYYWFLANMDILKSLGRATTIDYVSMSKLRDMTLQLPSLLKQREIVEKLDRAFAEIDLLQKNFSNLRNNYDELLHSFQMNSYGRSVTKVKIGDVCKLMTGGTPSRTRDDFFRNGTVKWLVSGDIHQGEIFDCEGRITTEAMRSSNTKILPINSVMIALNGQGKTRGTVALLKTEATCNQSLVSISPINIEALMPEFLFYNLKMRYRELRRMTGDGGNDRRGLNMVLLREIEIPLPSMANQIEIVKNLKLADESIQELKTQIELKEEHTKDLRKSLLSKSFSDTWEVA